MLLKTLTFPDQRPLQDDSPLFVPLTVLSSKFVDPSQFAVAVLAANVSYHVPSGEHHSVLHLAILEVHHLENRQANSFWNIYLHIEYVYWFDMRITSRHLFLYTLLKRKALPVAPVKRVEISSDLLVRMVSQLAQEKRRVPPMWSKKMRPIVKSLKCLN